VNVPFTSHHRIDSAGKPAGGYSESGGIAVRWQDGPLGRGPERVAPNGAFVETVIDIARERLGWYQSTEFACEENAAAIEHLTMALEVLDQRTRARERRGVEGTHHE
jgi:hypothetical protein